MRIPKSIFYAYFAAALSFGSGVLRDYVIVTTTDNATVFFQLFYVVSIASAFGCNALTLGSRTSGLLAHAVLALFSSLLIYVLIPAELRTLENILLLLSVLIFWTLGAFYSRVLVELRSIFMARSRETLASIICAIFVLIGISVEYSFAFAVSAGTLFVYFYATQLKKFKKKIHLGQLRFSAIIKLAYESIITNLGTFLINYWALIETSRANTMSVEGIDMTVIIRGSVYSYQLLTIGAVLLVLFRNNNPLLSPTALKGAVWLCLIIIVVSIALPSLYNVIIIPLACSILHYALIIRLQLKHNDKAT